MIKCDEIINAKEAKIIKTNFNEKNAICKEESFYNLFNLFIKYHCITDSC